MKLNYNKNKKGGVKKQGLNKNSIFNNMKLDNTLKMKAPKVSVF